MTTQPDIDPAYNFACPICQTTMGYQGNLEHRPYPAVDLKCRNCGFIGTREPAAEQEALEENWRGYVEERRLRTAEGLAVDVADFERRLKNVICDPEPDYEVENGLATILCPWCVEDFSFTDTLAMKSHGQDGPVTVRWTCEQGHKYKARM